MKTSRLAISLVAASLSALAFMHAAVAQPKSRAQVMQELAQARHDGVMPFSKSQYPSTESWIERNQEIHRVAVHGHDLAPALDAHDGTLAVR